jgi:molybdate transport system ATP-binding protein
MTLLVDVAVRRGGFSVACAFIAADGETLALLGPNGSGKSTVVETLAGLVEPAEGRISLADMVLDDVESGVHTPARERPIGVVFQDLRLFPHLSAIDNVVFPLRARGDGRAAARRAGAALLERTGAGGFAATKPPQLSGGQAQRVALARALAGGPRLLLLDEPLSALDVRSRRELRAVLRTTLRSFDGVRVLVTHDPVEAMTLADRIVILEDGAVTHSGTPEQIRAGPRTRYAAELVGLNLFSGRLERLEPGTGRLLTSDGEIVVGWPRDLSAGSDVVGLLKPSDVSLHADAPAGSARNVLPGRVELVSVEGDRARVRLATAPPLTAEITLGSLERLGVSEGVELWASFKALEVRLLAA